MPATEHLERSNELVIRNIVICALMYTTAGYCQILKNDQEHELVVQGIHFTLEQQYDSAAASFRTVMDTFPKRPTGYLYLAGLLQARYSDYGDYFNEQKYDSLLLTASVLSDSLKVQPGGKAWGYYYEGTADAFRSYTSSESGNVPAAFYYGLRAAKSMEKCIEIDSTFVAAKNVLGSYYYWRSKFSWIPFVSDRRDEGIRFIMETLHHPYERHLAYQNLMLILIDEKKYQEAENYGLEILKEYPENRSFLWNMMTAYEQSGDKVKTEEIVRRLLTSTMNAPIINRYSEATCRLKLARFAAERKDTVAAVRECRKILSLQHYKNTVKGDLSGKLQKAGDLLASLTKK